LFFVNLLLWSKITPPPPPTKKETRERGW